MKRRCVYRGRNGKIKTFQVHLADESALKAQKGEKGEVHRGKHFSHKVAILSAVMRKVGGKVQEIEKSSGELIKGSEKEEERKREFQ